MKRMICIMLIFSAVILFVPYIIVNTMTMAKKESTVTEQKITAYCTETDSVSEVNLEDYLVGVVAAEMPASFGEEALKAQAVAARSYILRRKQIYEADALPPEHKGALTCDDPAHCKAHLSDEKLREAWGDGYEEYKSKIEMCVRETEGVVMTYEGEIVNAVFHSTSSGNTENAKDVWGGDVEYLVSVKSEGDALSPKYEGEAVMTVDDFKETIRSAYPDAVWGEGADVVESVTRSDAGGIIKIVTGGIGMKGSEFRNLFSLKSANVEFSYEGDKIIMHTKGNGHGVGMSQYGANYLASTGMSYEDILKTYYTGVAVEKSN